MLKTKYRPHVTVKKLIDSGELKKPDLCERCKKEKILIAHHKDYLFPSDVIWLCKSCHMIIHHTTDIKHRNILKYSIKPKKPRIKNNENLSFCFNYFK